MKQLTYTVQATHDLDEIWEYTFANWGLDQAERYVRDLRAVCLALALGKKLGRATSVRRNYRSCICGAHIIWYRDLPDQIDVIRILHSAQDVERHLHD
jgi:toxin ParE1/3/4